MNGNRLFIDGAGGSMLTKVRLLAAVNAMQRAALMKIAAAITESPTPLIDPAPRRTKDSYTPYAGKQRVKAQWKTERRERK